MDIFNTHESYSYLSFLKDYICNFFYYESSLVIPKYDNFEMEPVEQISEPIEEENGWGWYVELE